MTSANDMSAAPGAQMRPAIVLCQSLTGLSLVRALAQAGVDVHGLMLDERSFTRFSRYGKKIPLYGKHKDETFLLQFLTGYCHKLGNHPVVFPSSDRMALFLAKHADTLRDCCLFSSTTYEDLASLVSKDGLYRQALAAGVGVIPHIISQDAGAIAAWSVDNAAPYLLKPFYDSIDTVRPFEKNIQLATREDLRDYVTMHGTQSMIVQRLIEGGDGYVFDCYGYCDRDGRVLTMASHRRLRQHPPNFGSTCFGEIPASFGADADRQIFENTTRLLGNLRFHGIFGIEWLYERETGRFYVIDFNARPFLTIGHLHACGLNLPLLAYQELTGQLPGQIDRQPALRHILWSDLTRDLLTLHEIETGELQALKIWLSTLLRCRSFGNPDWRDPGPGIAEVLAIARRFATYLGKQRGGGKTAAH